MNLPRALALGLFVLGTILIAPSPADAHPGGVRDDGSHVCRTNCESQGEVTGERHFHPDDGGGTGGGGGGGGTDNGPVDADGDGHSPPADCNDRDGRVHPGARETAGDGIDSDCDGRDPAPRPAVVGRLDRVFGKPGAVVVSGWAIETATRYPAVMSVTVDGRDALAGLRTTQRWAVRHRSDVARRFPENGPKAGFRFEVDGLNAGRHRVCVSAASANKSLPGADLGCRTVGVGRTDRPPIGATSRLRVGREGRVNISGVALDKDRVGSVRVALLVDGSEVVFTRPNLSSPGAARVHGSDYSMSRFVLRATLTPGRHQVCVSVRSLRPNGRTAKVPDKVLSCSRTIIRG